MSQARYGNVQFGKKFGVGGSFVGEGCVCVCV